MEVPEGETEDGIPGYFLCPITLVTMENPVIAADGHTYEHEAIERWIRFKGKSPITQVIFIKFPLLLLLPLGIYVIGSTSSKFKSKKSNSTIF